MKIVILIFFVFNSLAGAFGNCCCDSPSVKKQTTHSCCPDKTDSKLNLDAAPSDLPDTPTQTEQSCTKSCCQILFLGTLVSLEKHWTEGSLMALQGKVPLSIYKDSLTPPPRA